MKSGANIPPFAVMPILVRKLKRLTEKRPKTIKNKIVSTSWK
jgi:hypothetical protein